MTAQALTFKQYAEQQFLVAGHPGLISDLLSLCAEDPVMVQILGEDFHSSNPLVREVFSETVDIIIGSEIGGQDGTQ